MAEVIGWAMGVIGMWWLVYKLVSAIPGSVENRKAEEDAYWRSQGESF